MSKAPASVARKVVIQNTQGLHARPAAHFVQAASRFVSCDIWVTKEGGETVNGKSIMGLLMLAAAAGSELLIETTGEDAEEALEELCQLVASQFGMNQES